MQQTAKVVKMFVEKIVTTKFENAIIIKDFDSDVIFGDIIVCDDKIVYVGEHTDQTADKIIDARQNVIMPGFVNANANSFLSIFGKLIGGKKSQDFWAEVSKAQKKLSANDVYTANLYSAMQYAKSGITTVCENGILPQQIAKAYTELGLRLCVATKQKSDTKKFLSFEEMDKTYQQLSNISPLVTAHFACENVITDLEENFDIAQKLASKYNTFISANVSETLEEVGKCANQNDDMSPVSLLQDYGFFDRKTLINYATNVDSKDIRIIKQSGSNVCVLPVSDSKLSNGIAPIYQMLQYGINVCFGTGIGASFGSFDMFSQIRQAVANQNTLLSYADSISSRELLKMATTNGASALGLTNVGTLSVDSKADLILIDISNMIVHNIFDCIVYSCSKQNVLLTMINGKIVWDGKKINFKQTEKSILQKAKQISKKI